jgi:hypothetical protein
MKKINYREIYSQLGEDLKALNTLWDSGNNKMGRRVFAVFVFSTFESIGHLLIAYVTRGISIHGKGKIEARQIEAAKSKESGEVDPVEHINFALKFAAAFHGVTDFKPSDVPLWEDVGPSKKVRNRVVHPKTIENLDVSLEEHTSCKCALMWLWNCLTILTVLDQNPGATFCEVLSNMGNMKAPADTHQQRPERR